MIDYRETLKRFHEILPELEVDELLDLLNGIVEAPTLNLPIQRYPYDYDRIKTIPLSDRSVRTYPCDNTNTNTITCTYSASDSRPKAE